MTKTEWDKCNDAGCMIDFLWQNEPYLSLATKFKKYPAKENWQDHLHIDLPLYKFYLASCRNIWALLPQKESRKGIELAEQFVAGKIPWEQVSEYNWYTEGAAFCIDYETEPEQIASWIKDVESISESQLKKLVSSKQIIARTNARKLLLSAAYFADHSMIYPTITPKGPPRSHRQFMFAFLLRKHVDYPS